MRLLYLYIHVLFICRLCCNGIELMNLVTLFTNLDFETSEIIIVLLTLLNQIAIFIPQNILVDVAVMEKVGEVLNTLREKAKQVSTSCYTYVIITLFHLVCRTGY